MKDNNKNGIFGANPGCWALRKEDRYCDICLLYIPDDYIDKCGRDDKLKMFHYLVETPRKKDHIAVCLRCLDKIPDGYHGCGCGG